ASLSPGLQKMTARAAAAVPFATAAGLLAELAGVELPVKRTERSAEAAGVAAAQAIGRQADAICSRSVVPLPPPEPLPDMLYIAVDGTGVPVVAREAEGRRGKADDGKARTREIKLACLFTQTTLDKEGRPVRDPASTTYLATFERAERFGQLLDAEARRRAAHSRQLVFLGDGAAWIWNLAGQLFPAATQIVDLYHAREHLHDLANLAARLLAGHRDEWLAARLEELDNGDVEAILTAGRDLGFSGSLAAERDKQLGYFEHNAHRMGYQHFRDLGMFVGSGVAKPGARRLSGSGSNCRACAGASPGQSASPPCAARTPVTAGTRSG